MQILKKLSALLFVGLLLTAGACAQDDVEEIDQNIETTYDPDDTNGGEGMGGGN